MAGIKHLLLLSAILWSCILINEILICCTFFILKVTNESDKYYMVVSTPVAFTRWEKSGMFSYYYLNRSIFKNQYIESWDLFLGLN